MFKWLSFLPLYQVSIFDTSIMSKFKVLVSQQSYYRYAVISSKHSNKYVHIFSQGNLKEEIKLLQGAEAQVTNRVTELTQKKETFGVRQSTLLSSLNYACI